LTEDVVKEYQVSISRACHMMRLPKSQYYYQSRKDDTEVITILQQLAEQHPSYGFRKLFAYIRRSGRPWNHKRIYRVYRLLKLNKKRKGKRRLPARVKQPLQQQAAINQSWSMDFMSDSLVNGRKFRTLNVIDDCNREALAIEVDTSLSAKRVIRTLEQVITWRGKPQIIRVDNGPEYTSKDFELWAKSKAIAIQYIQPGRPMQNGFIERFNGSYRKEILDAYVFFELNEVRTITDEWIEKYNTNRPHEALGNLTPIEWKKRLEMKNLSNFELTE
jgi:putative transposase